MSVSRAFEGHFARKDTKIDESERVGIEPFSSIQRGMNGEFRRSAHGHQSSRSKGVQQHGYLFVIFVENMVFIMSVGAFPPMIGPSVFFK